MGDWKRTHDCGSLRPDNMDQKVVLMGWVNSRRDLGNLIFIDLRDREGITQVIFAAKSGQSGPPGGPEPPPAKQMRQFGQVQVHHEQPVTELMRNRFVAAMPNLPEVNSAVHRSGVPVKEGLR